MGYLKLNSLIFLIFFFSTILVAQQIWLENTYADFADGSFDDSGANMYVSAKGNIQMANRWDVNGDAHIDILCVNSHPLVEMLDLSVYWGNGVDFSIKNHTYIPANGPMWVTPGDLNNDAQLDLVVANYSNGTWTEMESFVYYGGLKDLKAREKNQGWEFYPFKERFELPGSNAQKAAIADFNKDGYKDIVFAFSGGFWEYRDKDMEGFSPSRIYWGSSHGFSKDNFVNIPTNGASDVVSADFDNNSWPDLVFANNSGKESFIYYGSENGFTEKRMKKIPTNKAHAVEVGDINNDGLFDLVFANESSEQSVAYLNKEGQFSVNRKIIFETHTAKDVVIQDFNKDGFTDIFFTNHQFSLTGNPRFANRLIDSYLYFGSQDGFSNDNRQSIQTIGAWGANAADLNKDGWVDLLICNFQEHYSYEVPSFIYWNGPEGFSISKRTPLYEHGAQGNAIADFNNDGHLDIILTSMMGNSRGDYDPSFLYFGDEKGQYSIANRVELPGREAYEQAFADLDDDEQVDILLLNRGEVTRQNNELWIYWNDNNTFDSWKKSGLPSISGLGVEVADLDRDGFLDVIISNGNELDADKHGNPTPGSFIYWGSEKGWSVTERSELPVVQTRAVGIADINNDGHLDLVFGQQGKWANASIFFGKGSRDFTNRTRIAGSSGSGTPGIADLNKDGLLDIAFAHDKNVLVYYQKQDGSFPEMPVKINVMAKTMCIADVNQDSWLDLVCPVYKNQGKRSSDSFILLGSETGYQLTNSIALPTDGGTGSIVSDFNNDGFQDIFFFCHRADGSFDEVNRFGDHNANSLIYWGSKSGFDKKNFLSIPSVGAHYDVGIDIGHIKDRSFIYNYISSPYKADNSSPIYINWECKLATKTSLKFQLRYADSQQELKDAIWHGADGENSFYSNSGSKIENIPTDKWIQYKAIFDTFNGANAPVLKKVEIELK